MRDLRVERAWTQATLSERAGLDVSYVSQLERGLRDPSLTSILALANAFAVPVAALVEDISDDKGVTASRAIAAELEGVPTDALDGVLAVLRAAVQLART